MSKLSKHEEFQERNKEMGRKIAELPGDASLVEIIAALVDKKQFALAVELLFGSRRESPLSDDQIGFRIYVKLWIGLYPEMIKKIAAAYHWNTEKVDLKRQKKSIKIYVYPGEVFTIEEPVATEIVKLLS